MPLLRINATDAGLTLHDTAQSAGYRLCALAARPGPAVIMVHGYKYAPGTDDHCPHEKLFGTSEYSWPAHLGFGNAHPREGLGIAFGWYARGALRSVHARASQLGQELAIVIALLRAHTPTRPIHIIAHSLGTEAALSALAHLPANTVDRMVLLTGASYAQRAAALLDTPAGRTTRVLNVTSRENDLFDAAFERLVAPEHRGDCAIGQGIPAPNAVTVQLDCPKTISGLREIGLPIAPPSKRICHWSAYKRPGVMAVYNRFLRHPETLPLKQLAAVLPQKSAPRWSRLVPLPRTAHLRQKISLSLPARTVGLSTRPPQDTYHRRDTNEPAY
ncbi:MAG: hypothetical protein AB8B62_15555 [Roseobacter sp.]